MSDKKLSAREEYQRDFYTARAETEKYFDEKWKENEEFDPIKAGLKKAIDKEDEWRIGQLTVGKMEGGFWFTLWDKLMYSVIDFALPDTIPHGVVVDILEFNGWERDDNP